MSDIKSVLSLIDNGDMETQFHRVAEELMNNWCIKHGMVEYQFLEIEFYYFSKNHPDLYFNPKNEQDSRNNKPFVYHRNPSRAGTLLMHDSGIDICFEGRVDDSDASCGGGLLIRSLLRIEGEERFIVEGPWDCRDAIFKYTDGPNSPILEQLAKPLSNHIGYTIRHNVKGKAKDYASSKYCAYALAKEGDHSNWEILRYDPTRLNPYKKTPYTAVPWNRK